MDLDLKIAGFGFEDFKRSDLDLYLTIFKGADLDLKVKLDLDLDFDLNIAGFAKSLVYEKYLI